MRGVVTLHYLYYVLRDERKDESSESAACCLHSESHVYTLVKIQWQHCHPNYMQSA